MTRPWRSPFAYQIPPATVDVVGDGEGGDLFRFEVEQHESIPRTSLPGLTDTAGVQKAPPIAPQGKGRSCLHPKPSCKLVIKER